MTDHQEGEGARLLRRRYILAGAVGLLVSIGPEAVTALYNLNFKWSYLADWAGRLGEALAVGAVIGSLLDAILLRSVSRAVDGHVSRIQRDVFEGVFRRLIDEDIFSTFKKSVLNCPVYRDPMKLYLTLRCEEVNVRGKKERLLKCDWHEEYTIRSLHSPVALHDLDILISTDEVDGVSHLCGITEVRIDREIHRGEPYIGASDGNGAWVYRKRLEVPRTTPVVVESYSTQYKTLTDAETFEFNMPTKGVELEVRVFDCRLAVRAHIMASAGSHVGGRHDPANGTFHWVADGAMLPHQGISLQWTPL